MRHLPNLLTLANLFCGCLAIAFVLHAQPFLYHSNTGAADYEWNWAHGVVQLHWGGILIIIAGVFDMLDGAAARALNIHSPIGKDLDSLADVVSFGVAPASILYQMLWDATAHEPKVSDVSLWLIAPAFLVACFAALRLARFNATPPGAEKGVFTGVPTPAIGLLVAGFALAGWDHPGGIFAFFQNRWVLYGLIALLCWLMVCNIRFMKLAPPVWSVAQLWPRALLVAVSVVLLFLYSFDAVPLIFGAYLLLSFFLPKAKTGESIRAESVTL